MQAAGRVVLTGLAGAVICAAVAAIGFAGVTLADGARAEEALAYGMVVGVIGLGIGALIGVIVGFGRMRPRSGALTGLLVALLVVAFYVLAFGEPGRYRYFLRESVVLLGLAVPTVAAGAGAAWLGHRRR